MNERIRRKEGACRKLVQIVLCLLVSINLMGNQILTANAKETTYTFPDENQKHEGTWLIWPHAHTYGKAYARSIEPIWIEMVKALAPGEHVHIIAYDQKLKKHIVSKLNEAGVDRNQVDFVIAKSDDVWARDTGPMFVYDAQGQLHIVDFGFDGWGKKTPYRKDDRIPQTVAKATGIPRIDVSKFVLEGGSVDIAADGTVLATKSAVISKNRNPHCSQAKAERYLKKYLGAKKFIWLEGVTDEDITDAHIDGFARFYDAQTILTVPEEDFFDLYENIKASDYDTLQEATNASGERYKIVEVPLTSKNVTGLDYKGSYLNYYLGKEVLLLPVYDDANDQTAVTIMQNLYPDHTIVPINVTALYKNGGMLHCVTQQQPLSQAE
ncbi:agmatine deiminase family protein [Catenisphaera adipataccumulans]|uniref:Agmatine deiminase n=1 Tax=Catenisphaera adipataccumulans TaxID=700500 RepID=A0A7W8FU16_9FIRM|nr:agmatine deiminase family protein [Catenisphaera adipataccumulans]MBB5182124.1 agmatine deiminase [Catenisphaera adipataccumulans]